MNSVTSYFTAILKALRLTCESSFHSADKGHKQRTPSDCFYRFFSQNGCKNGYNGSEAVPFVEPLAAEAQTLQEEIVGVAEPDTDDIV